MRCYFVLHDIIYTNLWSRFYNAINKGDIMYQITCSWLLMRRLLRLPTVGRLLPAKQTIKRVKPNTC
ncbi:hypothetical protein Hanom_Chr07g00596921 [Helianthus anomalus]|nr:hypothetical protein HanPSC8_Chr04g0144941 [Helianthus annuus]